MLRVPAGYGELLRFAHTTKAAEVRHVQRTAGAMRSRPDDPYVPKGARDVERIEPICSGELLPALKDATAGTSLRPIATTRGRLSPTRPDWGHRGAARPG